MSASAAAVAVAVEVAPTADNAVPGKIEALFGEYDTNGDGVISEVELTSSLEKAFPDMKPWAREHIPLQFQKYATGDPAGLDKPAFTKVYAAFLFRYFDDNGDGHLQVSECEAALKFLAGKDTAVACPPGDAAGIISKLDFWLSALSPAREFFASCLAAHNMHMHMHMHMHMRHAHMYTRAHHTRSCTCIRAQCSRR